MYLYKLVNSMSYNTDGDFKQLGHLVANADNVHHLLANLFGKEDEEQWRGKYNILYRVDSFRPYTLIVKSDIPIDMEEVSLQNFDIEVLKFNPVVGNEYNACLLFSPYRKNGESKKRMVKDKEERLDWLTQKLTCTGGCEVLSIDESRDKVCVYMKHSCSTKGEADLIGYDYDIKLKVLDKEKLIQTISKGVGPQKAYGFGLLRCFG